MNSNTPSHNASPSFGSQVEKKREKKKKLMMKRVQSTHTLTEMVRIVNSSVEDSSGGLILDEDDDTGKLYGGVSIWRQKYGRRTKARYAPLRMEDTLHNKDEDNKKDWRLKQSEG